MIEGNFNTLHIRWRIDNAILQEVYSSLPDSRLSNTQLDHYKGIKNILIIFFKFKIVTEGGGDGTRGI